ncbi:MAG TPA: LPS export ABC transporter permease LptG [Thermoanaerobaculia bacterium]
MSILTRYIFKEMLGPTFLGFGFYTFIILTQQLFDMAGLIIRRSLPGAIVGKLLLWSLPHIIVLTVPMSLLFGILIAVGRLSSDSEIIAMRALGLSTRTIYRPVFLFSFLIFLLSLYLMNYVTPRGNAQFQTLKAEIITSSAEKEVKPRIFFDQYANVMIYVNDVDAETGRWRGVFVADHRSSDDEPTQATTAQDLADQTPTDPSAEDDGAIGTFGSGDGQRIIVAESGNLTVSPPDAKGERQIWMNLRDAQNHTWDPSKPERYDLTSNASQRILLPTIGENDDNGNKLARSFREMELPELIQQQRELRHSRDQVNYNKARIEIHKKFAIPFACIAFGVLGLPLGITNRRGGKSSGFSLSIAIIVIYYVLINNGEQLAANGKIHPALGMWGGNILLLIAGIYLSIRANRDAGTQTEGGLLARLITRVIRLFRRRRNVSSTNVEDEPSVLNRLDITFPNILDRYILREFSKVLALVLVSVVALFVIIDYTEIARDVRANNVAFNTIFAYYRFHIFQVLHMTLPISVLVATLVTFGMLAKNNELTAIKSGGVSLFRVALPIIAVAAVISVLAYFILDFVLPYSNERVARLKRRIEGKTPITASAQQKLWFLGKGRYIINFLSYDHDTKTLSQVQIFEYAPSDFHLTRRVYANRARWNGKQWEFQDGWIRSILNDSSTTYTPIRQPIALQYAETPEDFSAEVKSPDQMTFRELRRYIATVKNAGYSADDLSVKLYTKTSWPAISMVMALIALPFAFRVGKRGALYGIGIALVLGITYTLIFGVITKFGEVGNLPPMLSAWSANILFAIAAVYMFLHVET